MSAKTFEEHLATIDAIIGKLENGELSLDESVKAYGEAMDLIKEASDMLKEAEGKIFKVGADGTTEEIKTES
ncbi:MAG: exodeoxyribonuclease VII small subunit [Fusobacteriaceae bacterium]|jgi:exodeoxyribonuclease VII small subunit|nr:exodeoxyribonuclease VII small subunit [Fusobacteriaceae bacterium]